MNGPAGCAVTQIFEAAQIPRVQQQPGEQAYISNIHAFAANVHQTTRLHEVQHGIWKLNQILLIVFSAISEQLACSMTTASHPQISCALS